MVHLKKFLSQYQYPDAVFDYICLRTFMDSGLAIFYVASVNAGKSTQISAIEDKYPSLGYAVQGLARVSPLRLLAIQDEINYQKAVLTSDDFSTMGQNEDATFKTVLMVTMVSYGKKYQDSLFRDKEHPKGLDIHVQSLSFVCGMQPYWLSQYAQKSVWETLIAEKVLRFYRLPIYPVRAMANQEMLKQYLNSLTFSSNPDYIIEQRTKNILRDALAVQCGNRAEEYAPLILKALKYYVPQQYYAEFVKQLAFRFKIEEKLILRYYAGELSDLPTTEVMHKQYSVLCNALAYNPLTMGKLAQILKIRDKTKDLTRQHISYLVKLAQDNGFVYCIRHKTEVRVYPTTVYQAYSLHKWRVGKKTENDIKLEIDGTPVVV